MPPRLLGNIPYGDTIKPSDIDGTLTGQRGARIRRTTAISTSGAVTFDQEDFDVGDLVNLGSQPTRITLNAAGIWLVGVSAITNDHGGNYDQLKLRRNGSQELLGLGLSEASSQGIHLHGSTPWLTTVDTDYIELVESDPGHHILAQGHLSIVMWAILQSSA